MNCYLCHNDGANEACDHAAEVRRVDCRHCGSYEIPESASFERWKTMDVDIRLSLAHRSQLRAAYGASGPLRIDDSLIEKLAKDVDLPSVSQQASNLIQYVGNQSKGMAEAVPFRLAECFLVGCRSHSELGALAKELEERGLIYEAGSVTETTQLSIDDPTLTRLKRFALSLNGWQRYEEMRKGGENLYFGFMAMSFDPHAPVAVAYEKCFRPAAQEAGFNLTRANEEERAGSIDDRMRVSIRTCSFVVADLTDGNPGVYWEAGFAEGLGKPVIFTCEESYHDSEGGTHFDTRQQATVLWRADALPEARGRLRATIRNTLPELAKMHDDQPAIIT